MFQPALLFVLIGLAVSACPSSFSDNGNGNCYSAWYDDLDHHSAYDRCAHTNSYMFDILNAFANSEVQSSAEGRNAVWLGLNCLNSSVATCQWDNGRQIKEDGYTNFLNGKPSLTSGACIFMEVRTGLWVNADCTTKTASARCLNVPAAPVTIPYCTDGSLYFRGNCYMGTVVSSFSDGVKHCVDWCGTMVSIHSDAENSIVADIASLNNDTKYGLLGLSQKPYQWADGSNYDYNRWGYEDDDIGTCAAIAGSNDVINKGSWISSPCNSTRYPLRTVCKKIVGNTCDPARPPLTCNGTTILKNSGHFYSPGYPEASGPITCEYVLIIDGPDNGNRRAVTLALNILEVSLDKNSSVSIYTSMFDSEPASRIYDTNKYRSTFISTGNTVKFVFKTTGSGNNFFHAYFGDGRKPCQSDIYYGSGIYKSEHYPGSFSYPNQCEIRILSSNTFVTSLLQDVEIQYGGKIFDGNGTVLLDDLHRQTNVTVASFSPVLRLYFFTGINNSCRGILAPFWSN